MRAESGMTLREDLGAALGADLGTALREDLGAAGFDAILVFADVLRDIMSWKSIFLDLESGIAND